MRVSFVYTNVSLSEPFIKSQLTASNIREIVETVWQDDC